MKHPRFINKGFTRADNEAFETYRPELVERGWWGAYCHYILKPKRYTPLNLPSPSQASRSRDAYKAALPSHEGASPSLQHAPHPLPPQFILWHTLSIFLQLSTPTPLPSHIYIQVPPPLHSHACCAHTHSWGCVHLQERCPGLKVR